MEDKNNEQNNSISLNYDIAELLKLKYVKVIYKGSDNKYHEIATKLDSIKDQKILLYCKYDESLKIKHPQEIVLKFVSDSYLYLAKSELLDAKKVNNIISLFVTLPQKLLKQQNRKYYRADLDCLCVLVATNKKNVSNTYLARSVNISANGILIHKVETVYNDGYIDYNMSDKDYYNIVIFLDSETVLKQPAKFVRQEYKNNICRYAFQLANINAKNTEAICKYVTGEQLKQLEEKNANDS